MSNIQQMLTILAAFFATEGGEKRKGQLPTQFEAKAAVKLSESFKN